MVVAAAAGVLPLPFAASVPDLAHIAQPPFQPGGHWLGTDPQGRDVLSLLVFGARTAVLLTVPGAVLAAALGALAGGSAGFWGNAFRLPVPLWLLLLGSLWWGLQLPWPVVGLALGAVGAGGWLLARFSKRPSPAWSVPLDSAVMGMATALDTIPRLVLVVSIAAGAGLSMSSLLVLLAFTAWAHPARLVRAQMLRVRALPFVEAAQAAGIPARRVWLFHALPHAIQPLRTAFPLSIAVLLGLESTLSFLGIGLPPNVASWGYLLGTVRSEPSAWWAFLFPVICLSTSILSLTILARSKNKDDG